MVRTPSHEPERRSAERFTLSLPVETDRGPATTRDVSVSGLYLLTQAGLAVGDPLELVLSLPDPDQPESPLMLQFVLRGRVVRVEEFEQIEGPREGEEIRGAGIALDEDSRYLALAS